MKFLTSIFYVLIKFSRVMQFVNKNFTFLEPPSKPTGPLRATEVLETSVTLQWAHPESDGGTPIMKYIVERKDATKNQWLTAVTVSGGHTEAFVEKLRTGNSYDFRVCAENSEGASEYLTTDKPIELKKRVVAPGEPSGPLKVMNKTENSADLKWKSVKETGGANITEYVVECRQGFGGDWTEVLTVNGSTTNCTVNDLQTGIDYWFRVAGKNQAGTGDYLTISEPVTVEKQQSEPGPPVGPLRVDIQSNVSIDVAWNKSETDGGSPITGYAVMVRETIRTMWIQVRLLNPFLNHAIALLLHSTAH